MCDIGWLQLKQNTEKRSSECFYKFLTKKKGLIFSLDFRNVNKSELYFENIQKIDVFIKRVNGDDRHSAWSKYGVCGFCIICWQVTKDMI